MQRYARMMSMEVSRPESQEGIMLYNELQRILMFREVVVAGNNGERNNKVNKQISAWVEQNGALFEQFFAEDDRGQQITWNFNHAADEAAKQAIIDHALEDYVRWREKHLT